MYVFIFPAQLDLYQFSLLFLFLCGATIIVAVRGAIVETGKMRTRLG
jgi:hypothetical protein